MLGGVGGGGGGGDVDCTSMHVSMSNSSENCLKVRHHSLDKHKPYRLPLSMRYCNIQFYYTVLCTDVEGLILYIIDSRPNYFMKILKLRKAMLRPISKKPLNVPDWGQVFLFNSGQKSWYTWLFLTISPLLPPPPYKCWISVFKVSPLKQRCMRRGELREEGPLLHRTRGNDENISNFQGVPHILLPRSVALRKQHDSTWLDLALCDQMLKNFFGLAEHRDPAVVICLLLLDDVLNSHGSQARHVSQMND